MQAGLILESLPPFVDFYIFFKPKKYIYIYIYIRSFPFLFPILIQTNAPLPSPFILFPKKKKMKERGWIHYLKHPLFHPPHPPALRFQQKSSPSAPYPSNHWIRSYLQGLYVCGESMFSRGM